jgi:hypothetical protein
LAAHPVEIEFEYGFLGSSVFSYGRAHTHRVSCGERGSSCPRGLLRDRFEWRADGGEWVDPGEASHDPSKK